MFEEFAEIRCLVINIPESIAFIIGSSKIVMETNGGK